MLYSLPAPFLAIYHEHRSISSFWDGIIIGSASLGLVNLYAASISNMTIACYLIGPYLDGHYLDGPYYGRPLFGRKQGSTEISKFVFLCFNSLWLSIPSFVSHKSKVYGAGRKGPCFHDVLCMMN